jgi:general secretion pathway protein A
MYTSYFRLNEPPFSLTPDPRYLYMSERHREGLAHLLYGAQQSGGFIQLTGEIGCGKTTLCRCLVNQLTPETDIALILNPRLTAIELLATFCDELHIPYPAGTDSIKVLIDALNRYLLGSHAQGRRTVLIIDEAQNLHPEVLEQIRLLTNLETEQKKLLQIILIGQPELLIILKQSNLRQLAQRITARYHLLPLSRQETYAYIQHRLRIAGRIDPVFSKQAMRSVYRITGGVPRLINTLCDRALLGAYTLDRQGINASIVRKAGREITKTVSLQRHRRMVYATVVIAFLVIFGIVALLFNAGHLPDFLKKASGTTGYPSSPENIIVESETGRIRPDNDVTSDRKLPESSASGNPVQQNNPVAGIEDRGNDSIPAAPMIERAPDTSETGTDIIARSSPQLFEEIIRNLSQSNSLATSFNSLYARWGIDIRLKPSELGCTAGRIHGFECLFMTGDWLKLRRLNIPAILEIRPSNDRKLYVTLVELDDNIATLAIDNLEYSFPLQEIHRIWDGAFIAIWPPPFDKLMIPPGTNGEEVIWVRRALDVFEGSPLSSNPSGLYDENLTQRIRAFQKSQRLVPDGRIGPETLVRLTIAMSGNGVPSLSRHSP